MSFIDPLNSVKNWVLQHPVKTTSLTGILVQLGRPFISLLTIPLLYSHLDEASMGVWFIGLSIMGLISFFSNGISSSLITHIGRETGLGKDQKITRWIMAGFVVSSIFATVLIIVTLPIVLLLDLNQIFNLNDTELSLDFKNLIIVILVVMATSSIAIIPRQAMFGQMHGYLAHFLDLIGLVFGTVALIVSINLDMPLWLMATVFLFPSLLFPFVGGLIYLKKRNITLFSLSALDMETFQQFKSDALRMSGYQLAFSISSQTDLLLIGMVLGASATVSFGIAQRAFSIIMLIFYSINAAQWPSMARDNVLKDTDKLSIFFKRTLLSISILSTFIAMLLFLNYTQIINLWLGSVPETETLLLGGFVAWISVATSTNVCDILLRAKNETSRLMRHMIAMATVNIVLTLILLPHFGAAGAIFGSVFAYLFILLIPYLWYIRSTFMLPN